MQYDVLCYGAVCADHLIFLPRYPRPGEGIRIVREEWHAGGNALLEAGALACWGWRVALMGDAVGNDDPGTIVWSALANLPLASNLLARSDGPTIVCRILITPDGQRTILALRGPSPVAELPSAELLARCRLVSLSRYGPHTAEVARLVGQSGRTLVVGDAARPDEPWSAWATVIVSSAELLAALSPTATIEQQMVVLHQVRGAAVVVTDGPRPARVLWHEEGKLRWATAQPPHCAIADTTGAGDIFRAAIVTGLLDAQPWPQMLQHACATATDYLAGK